MSDDGPLGSKHIATKTTTTKWCQWFLLINRISENTTGRVSLKSNNRLNYRNWQGTSSVSDAERRVPVACHVHKGRWLTLKRTCPADETGLRQLGSVSVLMQIKQWLSVRIQITLLARHRTCHCNNTCTVSEHVSHARGKLCNNFLVAVTRNRHTTQHPLRTPYTKLELTGKIQLK
jgi:hypothetical protein